MDRNSFRNELEKTIGPYLSKLKSIVSAQDTTRGEVEAEFRYQKLQHDEYERLLDVMRTSWSKDAHMAKIECMDIISPKFIDKLRPDSRDYRTRMTITNTKAISNIICDRQWLRRPECMSCGTIKSIQTLLYSTDLKMGACPNLKFGSKYEQTITPAQSHYDRWIEDLLNRVSTVESIKTQMVVHQMEVCFRLKERHELYLPGQCRIHLTRCRTASIPSELLKTAYVYDLEIELEPGLTSISAAIRWVEKCIGVIFNAPLLASTPIYDVLLHRYISIKHSIISKIACNDVISDEGAILSPKLAALFEPCIERIESYTVSLKVDGVNANYMIAVLGFSLIVCRIISYLGRSLRLDVMNVITFSERDVPVLFGIFGTSDPTRQTVDTFKHLALKKTADAFRDQFRLYPFIILINGESCTFPSHAFVPFDVYFWNTTDLLFTEPQHEKRLWYFSEWLRRVQWFCTKGSTETIHDELNKAFIIKSFLPITSVENLASCIDQLHAMDKLKDRSMNIDIKTDGYILTPKYQSPDFASPIAWMTNYKVKAPEEITIDVQVKSIRYDKQIDLYTADIFPHVISEHKIGLGAPITILQFTANEKKKHVIIEDSVVECVFTGTRPQFQLKLVRSRLDKCRPNRDLTVSQIYDYVFTYSHQQHGSANPSAIAELEIFKVPDVNRTTGFGAYHFTPVPVLAPGQSVTALSAEIGSIRDKESTPISPRTQGLLTMRRHIEAFCLRSGTDGSDSVITWADLSLTLTSQQVLEMIDYVSSIALSVGRTIELSLYIHMPLPQLPAAIRIRRIRADGLDAIDLSAPWENKMIVTMVDSARFLFEDYSDAMRTRTIVKTLADRVMNRSLIAIWDMDQHAVVAWLKRQVRSTAAPAPFKRCSEFSWLMYDPSVTPHYILGRPLVYSDILPAVEAWNEWSPITDRIGHIMYSAIDDSHPLYSIACIEIKSQ